MVLRAEDGGKDGHVVSFKAVGWRKCSVKAPSDEGKQIIFPSQLMNHPSVVTHLQTHGAHKNLHKSLYCDHWPSLARNRADCKIQTLKNL